MAAEDTLPYGRSPSRASRAVYDTSIEQVSFFGQKSSKKSQQKSASDKLVWFPPVHSPLLSPAREKTLHTGRKKLRNSSIFSIQSRAKGSIEAEEPTSPKVSCIGQVRAYKKDKDPFADTSKKKVSQSKPGSMSPARFFASRGRATKWGSLFGSRKDSCAAPNSSGYGGGEVSCFGLPFNPRSMYSSDKTGAIIAKSLVLLQELDASSNSNVTPLCIHASDFELEKQETWVAVNGHSDRYTYDESDSRVFGEARAFVVGNHNIFQKKGASTNEESRDLHTDVKDTDGKESIIHVESNEEVAHSGSGLEKSFQEQHHLGKPAASKQRLTYEELPSLHCGPSMKQNMKVSVEVVPETWLWRNGERLQPDSTSQRNSVLERSASASREDILNAQENEANTLVSSCSEAQLDTREGEGCVDSENAHIEDKSYFVPVHANLDPVDNTTCKLRQVDSKGKDDTQFTHVDEVRQAHQMGACKEETKEIRSLGINEDGAQVDKHQSLHGEKQLKGEIDVKKHQILLDSKGELDLVKHHILLGPTELKNRHRRLRRISPDVGNGIAPPQSVEKKLLSSVHSNEDRKRLWSIFKGRKSDTFSVQPFSTVILVGYDQPIAVSKDSVQKVSHDEEFLKGILEVGRLSFHRSGKYFQVLKGDNEFIRSRSATSYRTVITLPRCNSDPCRPSY